MTLQTAKLLLAQKHLGLQTQLLSAANHACQQCRQLKQTAHSCDQKHQSQQQRLTSGPRCTEQHSRCSISRNAPKNKTTPFSKSAGVECASGRSARMQLVLRSSCGADDDHCVECAAHEMGIVMPSASLYYCSMAIAICRGRHLAVWTCGVCVDEVSTSV